MLTAEQHRQLEAVHRNVKENFIYVPDIEKWKTPEYWMSVKDILLQEQHGKYTGDCDDFALIVRYHLRKLQIPNRLLMCWIPAARGYHLELYSYGFISECNSSFVRTLDELDQENIMLSGFEKGEDWHYVKPFTATTIWPHLRGNHA